uniref:Uncharacterized protein n=1 Tax=Zea mays TaxID=4577 RepID=B4FBS7_MAIZE|nr:unknown [Zea mays]
MMELKSRYQMEVRVQTCQIFIGNKHSVWRCQTMAQLGYQAHRLFQGY